MDGYFVKEASKTVPAGIVLVRVEALAGHVLHSAYRQRPTLKRTILSCPLLVENVLRFSAAKNTLKYRYNNYDIKQEGDS